MSKILLAVITVLLSGCYGGSLDVSKSHYACKDHGGLYHHNDATGLATCQNGKTFSSIDLRSVLIDDPAFYPENLKPNGEIKIDIE